MPTCHGGRGQIRQAYREGRETSLPPWGWSSTRWCCGTPATRTPPWPGSAPRATTARTRTSHASPRSRTGTSTSWAAICSGRAVAVARRPCPADHTTSAGGGLRLPRRPVPPFGPPRCRHAHGVVTPNPWATNSVTCAGSSCMSLKRPHGTPATWTPPVNSSMAERDLGLAEHRPVAPTGTRLPLSPAAVRSGSQFFCRARVTPAMTAVVNTQPKAISRYASHWRPSFGQYQAVRWPRPPMGIRRSSV